MIFGTCKLQTTRSGVMHILSKFYYDKHLTRKMAPLRINTTDAYSYRQLETPANSSSASSVITYAKKQQCCGVQMSTSRCVPELLLSHLTKNIEFHLCIQMLPSKM